MWVRQRVRANIISGVHIDPQSIREKIAAAAGVSERRVREEGKVGKLMLCFGMDCQGISTTTRAHM